jgi:hypothetical protein
VYKQFTTPGREVKELMELFGIVLVQILCVLLPAYAAWSFVPASNTPLGMYLHSRFNKNFCACNFLVKSPTARYWLGALLWFDVTVMQAVIRITTVVAFENHTMPNASITTIGGYDFSRRAIYALFGAETIFFFLVFLCIFLGVSRAHNILATILAILGFAASVLVTIGLFYDELFWQGILQIILNIFFVVVTSFCVLHVSTYISEEKSNQHHH